MSDTFTDNDDDELSATQEHVIAAGVVLLFGLLYWFLNYGWTMDTDTSGLSKADVTIGAQAKPGLEGATVATEVMAPASKQASSTVAATTAPAAQSGTQQAVALAPASQETPTLPAPVAAAPAVAAGIANQATQTATAVDAGPVGPASSPAITVTAQPPPAQTAHTTDKPVGNAVAGMQPLVYKFPDGKEVTVGSSGFEGAFRQAIAHAEINKPIVFDNIQFERGSTSISAASDQQIRATAALLQTNPQIRVLVRGHTDETGMSGSNTELSLMRANEVGVALVNLGVDRRRLRIMGMGDLNPVDTNATEEGRKRNRRVDLMILP